MNDTHIARSNEMSILKGDSKINQRVDSPYNF